MAKTEGNLFTEGFSGKVGGNMVFRKRKSGKTVVAKNSRATNIPPTDKQINVRERFKMGVIYAKSAMANTELNAMYSQMLGSNQSVYNVALRDSCKSPEIKSLNVAAYTGQPESIITVRAIDDFKVTSVKVSVYSAADALIEEGNAVVELNGLDWKYTATVANGQVAGTKIKAVAFDTPGNEGALEVTL